MKSQITLIFLALPITIFLSSCSGISQQTYDDAITQLNSMNIKYVQTTRENNNLKSELAESSKKLEELQPGLSQSEQTISSLQTEIDNLKSHPLATDVEVYTGTIIRGRTVVGSLNYFDRIEGKVIGDGFRAYLKDSSGNIVVDLGTNHERKFSFTRPNPGVPPFIDYHLDYEIIDSTNDRLQYIVAYVLFYHK